MPRYRVHRMKDAPLEQFRWAPHVGGLAVVKPKDYDFSRETEAATPYAVWKLLSEEGEPLRAGDLLELATGDGTPGELRIAKYIGFEPAQWFVPEPRGEGTGTSYSATPAPSSFDDGERAAGLAGASGENFPDQPSHSAAR